MFNKLSIIVKILVSQLTSTVAGTNAEDFDGPYNIEWSKLFGAQNELQDIHWQGIRDELDAKAFATKLKQLAKVATTKARKEKKSLSAAYRLNARKKHQREQQATK